MHPADTEDAERGLITPLDLGAIPEDEIERTLGYAENEKAPASRRAYATDWRHFARWCADRNLAPLGCAPGVAAAYLSDLAHQGRKASTIARKAAAIGHHHRIAGLEPPTAFEGVKAVMRGIRRTIGTARTQKTPATQDIIAAMLDACTDSLAGIRDRALISVGFATAMRRSELIALELADLAPVEDGYRVIIRRSKGDQEGEGQEVAPRLPAAPGRTSPGVARGRRDHRWPGVPQRHLRPCRRIDVELRDQPAHQAAGRARRHLLWPEHSAPGDRNRRYRLGGAGGFPARSRPDRAEGAAMTDLQWFTGQAAGG